MKVATHYKALSAEAQRLFSFRRSGFSREFYL